MKLENKKTVVLGLAFKANIDDTRESLSAKVIKALERERAQVFTHDPLIKEHKDNLDEKLKDADLVFVATPHNWYRHNLTANKLKGLVKKNCLICDIWNVFGTDKVILSLSSLTNGEHGTKKFP